MKFPRPVRWRRLAAMAVCVVLILGVGYLVVANVLLRTRLLRTAVSGDSRSLRLDYESAYSIIPGRVHLEGLTLRGRDQTMEWWLTIDHADARIALVDLLRRDFHATRVRASGFAIRVRPRLARGDATPDVVSALPPIAGFADPPLMDEGPQPPPLTDAEYNLWMVDLEDVEVEHVREVWINTVRSEGDSHVRGRWVFRPERWLEVGPATVAVNGIDVSYAGHGVATGLRGTFEATVHPFDLRQVSGLAILDQVSYREELRGRMLVAGVLAWLPARSGVRVMRCEGPIDTRVALDRGILASGAQVRIDTARCELEAKGLLFAAPMRAELGVHGGLATLHGRASGVRVSHRGEEQARIASLVATVSSRRLRLADLFHDARLSVDVVGAETGGVDRWRHWLPSTSPFVVRSGPVTGDAHVDGSLAQGSGRARLRLLARRLTVECGHDQLTSDVAGEAELQQVSLPGGWAVGAATISADEVAVRLGRAVLAGQLAVHVALRRWTWADRGFDLSGSHATLRNVTARHGRDGVATLVIPALTAAAPRLALAPAGVDGSLSLDLPRAELVDLRGLHEWLRLPPAVAIAGGTGRARLHAEVDLGSGSIRGEGEVVARAIRARVGSTDLFGDLEGALRARRDGGASGATDISGSAVLVSHAGTGGKASAQSGWWGRVSLRDAILRTSGDMGLHAKVHLTARDAGPAAALVSQNTAVPSWAAKVFRMPSLVADAEVRIDPASFELRRLAAHGGRTAVRAEYAQRAGRHDGAVLLDLGWIDLGYDLAQGATRLVLIGPQRWYGRKTAALRGAEASSDAEEESARYAAMTPELREAEARALAARCALEVRSCAGDSVESLLRAAADAGERDTLSGITHAPMVVAAAKRGTDGSILDPLVIGSAAEALRIGSESTLDHIPSVERVTAAMDSDAARGKVITIAGSVTSLRSEGTYSVGTLTTLAGPVYFVTPFETHRGVATFARFRGVFVQRYAPHGRAPSLVLVGTFGPQVDGVRSPRSDVSARSAPGVASLR